MLWHRCQEPVAPDGQKLLCGFVLDTLYNQPNQSGPQSSSAWEGYRWYETYYSNIACVSMFQFNYVFIGVEHMYV